jgi:hypothetical protein
MAYHLLPSATYFSSNQNAPLVSFDAPHAYVKEIEAYGSTIDTWNELASYLSALVNPALISYAENAHGELDAWTPPAGVSMYQVAGTGIDTIAGIEYYEEPDASGVFSGGYAARYRPAFTMEGDGTVPTISALLMRADASSVKSYWFDLETFNARTHDGRSHASMLGADSFLDFTKDILTHSSIESQDISAAPIQDDRERIRFMLHSPLSLNVYDKSNRHTGLNNDGSLVEDIPDTTYGEFGDVKYITAPLGENYELKLRGEGTGNFSLDIQEAVGDESTTTTIANVPTIVATSATLDVSKTGTTSPLRVDENGDGTIDFSIIPIVGETVFYEPAQATSTVATSTETATATPSTDSGQTATTTTETNSTTAPPVTELIQEQSKHSSRFSRVHKPTVVIASSTSPLHTAVVANPLPYGPQFVVADAMPVSAPVPYAPSSQSAETQLASVYAALPHASVFSRIIYSVGSFLSAAGRSLERLSGLSDAS